jgi:hypothetical protein
MKTNFQVKKMLAILYNLPITNPLFTHIRRTLRTHIHMILTHDPSVQDVQDLTHREQFTTVNVYILWNEYLYYIFS